MLCVVLLCLSKALRVRVVMYIHYHSRDLLERDDQLYGVCWLHPFHRPGCHDPTNGGTDGRWVLRGREGGREGGRE